VRVLITIIVVIGRMTHFGEILAVDFSAGSDSFLPESIHSRE
jgi:hypothetical protein